MIQRDEVLLLLADSGEPWRLAARCRDMSIKQPDAPNTKLPPRPNPPGGSAALPEGSLPDPHLGPQGDENRDPPANAPAPVPPTETVKDINRTD